MPSNRQGLSSLSFPKALEVARALGKLSTGSAALDDLLEGGYEQGRISEVFGASNTGKTQLAMQAAVLAAGRGWNSLYVDTESTFRPERVEEMARARGIDASAALERIFWVRARDVESQIEVTMSMSENERVLSAKLVVVDTVTKNFSLEFPGRERTGRRQGALGAYLDGIALDAYYNKRVVLLTNRVAAIPREGQSQEVDLGGLTLRKFVSKSIRLTRQGSFVHASIDSAGRSQKAIKCQISKRGFD